MIRVDHVSKSYGTTKALDDVSFSVEKNQILGFLGPNGAGKSTAMKIITTYLSPDSGKVTVDEVDVVQDPQAVRRKIGYLPETAPLYDDMRTIHYLDFVAQARGLEGLRLKQRLEWVYDVTNIRSVLFKPINALSKGFRQRVGLAQALVHDPDILILDEPTSGLDPRQIIDIRNLIHDLAASKTIIFSSHILAEISAVTNRIAIINEGRIVADGQVDELRRGARKLNTTVVELASQNGDPATALRGIPGVTNVDRRPGSSAGRDALVVQSNVDRDVRSDIGRMARDKGWDLLELYTEQPTLEEAFIALTGREVEKR
jgi:ABC-2 type transport system ATP-binding protein